MNKSDDSATNVGPIVALHYSGRGTAQVVLDGGELLAQRIIALAQQQGIHHELNPALASTLAHVELSPEIPQELYLATAQVLAFVWGTTQQ